jgi:hypothetical protein
MAQLMPTTPQTTDRQDQNLVLKIDQLRSNTSPTVNGTPAADQSLARGSNADWGGA